jgi:guanylate kinase
MTSTTHLAALNALTTAPYPLTVLAGCSGVGKDTLFKAMQALPQCPLIKTISATTRPPRTGEVDGIDYHFLSRATFEEKIQQHELLEWATFSKNLYGTLLSEVKTKLQLGPVCLVIELEGIRQLKALAAGQHLNHPFKSLFIVPQGFPTTANLNDVELDAALDPLLATLHQRLTQRGTDSPEAVELRLNKAKQELLTVYRSLYTHSHTNSGEALPLIDALFINPTHSEARPLSSIAAELLIQLNTLHTLHTFNPAPHDTPSA